jgi:hypothetical protein
MTTTARVVATQIAGSFQGDQDRARTTHHHPGQMTVADYRALDKVEPDELAGHCPATARASRSLPMGPNTCCWPGVTASPAPAPTGPTTGARWPRTS